MQKTPLDMNSAFKWAALTAVLLIAFIIIRPIIGRLGMPPEVKNIGPPPTVAKKVPPSDLGIKRAAIQNTPTLPQPNITPDMPPPSGISYLEDVEGYIHDLTNAERQKHNKTPLNPEDRLSDIARSHSSDMIKRDFFDHMNPDGRAPGDRVALFHRSLIGLSGENIWMGKGHDTADSRKLAEKIVEDWMNSPGHRANILRDNYTHLGIGVSVKGDEIRATQNFADIFAMTDQDVPNQFRSGDQLNLSITNISKTSDPPDKYDLWSAPEGIRVAGPFSTSDQLTTNQKGAYRLRFYFPTDKSGSITGYEICPGPEVDIN